MFYVYAHLNPINLKPFYIGKGKGDRKDSSFHRSNWWQNYTNKHGFVAVTLVDGLNNEQACEIEKQYIKRYGFLKSGGLLINQTNGGEGGNTFDPINGKNWNSGKKGVYKPETIEKIRRSRQGQRLKGEHREKVLAGLRKAGEASLISRTHKVRCLVIGKVWDGRQDCVRDLNITIPNFKQRILKDRLIKGNHLRLCK